MIVNPTTGEVMDFSNQSIWIQTDEDRKRAKEFFKRSEEKSSAGDLYKQYGKFVWNIYSVSKNTFPDLKASYVTRLMFLATYIGYDGRIVDCKNCSLSKLQIKSLLNVSDGEFKRFYKSMKDNKILIEETDGIKINQDLFKRGNLNKQELAILTQDEKYITRIYIKAVRSLYNKATITSHKTLGYIFQIMPYVNRQYNICCKNPLETDLSKIEKMTLGEFCDVIGYDKNQVSRLCNVLFEPQFEINGEVKTAMRYVVDKGFDKKSYSMFINPNVYYAGDRWNEVKVLGQF